MPRSSAAFFSLKNLGFHSSSVRVSIIYSKIHRNRSYLINYRYFGPLHVTWELLSADLKRLWIVCFDTELISLLDQWQAVSAEGLYSARYILKQEIVRRFRLLYRRVHVFVTDSEPVSNH